MKRRPDVPALADAPPDFLAGGHLWIQELVDGGPLRFTTQDSGLLVFGDDERVFDHDAIPPRYRYAARHVRDSFDVESLRAGTTNVEDYVFFGVATYRRTVDYEWDRIPAFLGFDIWDASEEAFFPPDVVKRAFTRLGLVPANAFEKETQAAYFDPERYEFPASNWYDGPAAGVVLRKKSGERATLSNPNAEATDPPATSAATPEELAAFVASDERVTQLVERLDPPDEEVALDRTVERILEAGVREEYAQLPDESALDTRAFNTAIVARVRSVLDNPTE